MDFFVIYNDGVILSILLERKVDHDVKRTSDIKIIVAKR